MSDVSISKGLDAILKVGGTRLKFNAENSDSSELTNSIELPVKLIKANKAQPRKVFDTEAIKNLSDSIKENGVLQPIIVREVDDGSYEVIAGERRWRAAIDAKLTHIPVVIKNVDEQTVLAFSLIENIQREALNPIEEAFAYKRLSDEFKLKHNEIAEKVGRSRATVSNIMRLLELAEPIKTMLLSKKLEMGHARALVVLAPEEQEYIAQKIVEGNLSVRDTEKLVNKMKNTKSLERDIIQPYKEDAERWSKLFTKKLSKSVTVKINNEGRGKLVINFDSPDEIDTFLDRL